MKETYTALAPSLMLMDNRKTVDVDLGNIFQVKYSNICLSRCNSEAKKVKKKKRRKKIVPLNKHCNVNTEPRGTFYQYSEKAFSRSFVYQ